MERELRRSPELERFSLVNRAWQSELNDLLPNIEADGISHDLFDWPPLRSISSDLLTLDPHTNSLASHVRLLLA